MSPVSSRLFQLQEMRQEMRINPRLYQSMELLYMPLLDLQKHLESELEENPFLELTESDSGEEPDQKSSTEDVEVEVSVGKDHDKEDNPLDNLSWENLDSEYISPGESRVGSEVRESWEPLLVESTDLREHLTRQLRLILENERDMRVGEEVIGNLSDDGMLTCDLMAILKDLNSWLNEIRDTAQQEIQNLDTEVERSESMDEIDALFAPYSIAELEKSLEIVQSLDPSGVGARDVRESILIQLEQQGKSDELSYCLVESYFALLLDHKWDEIARDRGISVQEVQEVADEIATLDPKPGLKYSVEPDSYIVPDLIVEEIEGEWLVFSNDTHLPRLKIAQSYKSLLQQGDRLDGENKEFITRKMNSAHWMVQAIEQRRQTMINVMRFLIEKQRDFFEQGVESLKPLTLREVADYIEVHESTVSRVVNQKYVQTPRGVFSLKYFFSSGLKVAGGTSISAKGVQSKIKKIIDGENSKAPFSDQKIKDILGRAGVSIARRTVAKYRDQAGIPQARVRKRV